MATPIPDIYSEITVASAAPLTPLLRAKTKYRSRPIFNIVEIARNNRGIVELPNALKKEENQL